jgi:ABC-type Fe3+/spermidine/putrescine transport system ATPase subunit
VRGAAGGVVAVECGGALVCAASVGTPEVGSAVTLSTRPERMRFADTTAPGQRENRLRAVVTEVIFAGERCRYLLRSASGETIVLKEASGATNRRRAPGETAELAWSITDTVMV